MRSIANLVEYATISHLTEDAFVSDDEMQQIMSDGELGQTLKKAMAEVRARRYTVVPGLYLPAVLCILLLERFICVVHKIVLQRTPERRTNGSFVGPTGRMGLNAAANASLEWAGSNTDGCLDGLNLNAHTVILWKLQF